MQYEFRVFAENLAGIGKYSKVSDPILTKDAVDAPIDLTVVEVTDENVILEWKKPEYDGGAKITGKYSLGNGPPRLVALDKWYNPDLMHLMLNLILRRHVLDMD